MQQYLPFTVLKLCTDASPCGLYLVATVLTVYGIETEYTTWTKDASGIVATVLTVYGIETFDDHFRVGCWTNEVATVLTVYGIETM